MKIINTFDGQEFPISDVFFETIEEKMKNNNFVRLEDGSIVNVKTIASIANPPTSSYWNGWKLSKNGDSFLRDDVRVYLEPHNFAQVTEEYSEKHYKWAKMLGEDGIAQIEKTGEDYKDQKSSQFGIDLAKKFEVSSNVS